MVKILAIYCVGLVFMAQLLDTVTGLKCYNCEAPIGTNNSCEVNVKNISMMTCSENFVCTTYKKSVGNKINITRLCSQKNECEVLSAANSHVLDSGDRTGIDCYSCSNSDGCNSANTFVLNFMQYSSLPILVIALNVLNNKLKFVY